MRKGFSLLEMLVVMSVLIVLTSTLLLYNRTGERQLIILREKARLLGAIVQAKAYAVNTLVDAAPACGYGVHIDPAAGTYFLYRDRAINCRTSDHIYGAASDEIVRGSENTLAIGFAFGDHTLSDIVFVPPDPSVYLNGGSVIRESVIMIRSADGSAQGIVTITDAGQISG